MCIVYNSIGSLTAIKSHLHKHNLDDFRSVKELVNFQRSFLDAKQQIITNHSLLIEKEKTLLAKELEDLNNQINRERHQIKQQLESELDELNKQLNDFSSVHANIFRKLDAYLKKSRIKKAIKKTKQTINSKIEQSVQHLTAALAEKTNRYHFINSDFEQAVNESGFSQCRELERKKKVIDEVTNFIHGAYGEQKVATELLKLSDDYILINDFTCSFYPPLYYRQEDSYIKSIQVDHLLISPSGVFIIETKNWSQKSLTDISLRSPIQQIKRANFALFKLLSAGGIKPTLVLNEHHWGGRKIPLKNLIVLINQKPREDFEHVKVLTIKELVSYVQYFRPSLSWNEVRMIGNYLLELNQKNQGSNELFYR